MENKKAVEITESTSHSVMDQLKKKREENMLQYHSKGYLQLYSTVCSITHHALENYKC